MLRLALVGSLAAFALQASAALPHAALGARSGDAQNAPIHAPEHPDDCQICQAGSAARGLLPGAGPAPIPAATRPVLAHPGRGPAAPGARSARPPARGPPLRPAV